MLVTWYISYLVSEASDLFSAVSILCMTNADIIHSEAEVVFLLVCVTIISDLSDCQI